MDGICGGRNRTSGTYEEPLTTTLTTVTEGAVIYYTTDGTEPTTESMVYTEPIKIEPFKTVIKAVAYKEGVFPSNVVTYEYIIDPTVGLDEMVDQIQELMGNLEDESAYKQNHFSAFFMQGKHKLFY